MIREQSYPLQSALSVEYKVNFGNGKRKTKVKRKLPSNPLKTTNKPHRITRLLALAHHLQALIDQGIVKDYADIACLVNLSRPRVTQIMNLALLAPQIQEEMLFSNNGTPFPNHLTEQSMRLVIKTPVWEEQIKIWKKLNTSNS